MRKLAVLGAFLLASTLGCSQCDKFGCIDNDDVLNYYETNIEALKAKISLAFDEAEKKVFVDDVDVPTPKGPHPDPDKCVCGGTGKIKHGDGHTTPCPYHSGENATQPDVDGKILYKRSK